MTSQTLCADNLAVWPNKHVHDCRPFDVRLLDRPEDVLLARGNFSGFASSQELARLANWIGMDLKRNRFSAKVFTVD